MSTLAPALAAIERAPLERIPPAQAAKVLRRIVGNAKLSPRLTVTAFNSAP